MFVNVDGINYVISKNDMSFNIIDDKAKNIVSGIHELNLLCSGNDIQFLLNDVLEQVVNVELIPKVIKNYSDIMTGVKTMYGVQDTKIISQMSYMISRTNTIEGEIKK